MPFCCAVPACNSGKSGFKFPADPKVRKKWCVAIRREGPGKKLWQPTKSSLVCGSHFQAIDFKVPISSYVSVGGRRRLLLKAGAVPSVFPHNTKKKTDEQIRKSEERRDRRETRKETAGGAKVLKVIQVVKARAEAEELPDLIHVPFDPLLSEEVETTQAVDVETVRAGPVRRCRATQTENEEEEEPPPPNPKQLISIERIKGDAEIVRYYTSFEDHDHFKFFYQCLGPAAEHLNYKSGSLSPQDELLLCLMKLCQNKDDEELGILFGVSKSMAGRLFVTWTNFMYYQLKEIDLFDAVHLGDLVQDLAVGDPGIASKRVHVERLAKTFKILQDELDRPTTVLGSRILFVCFLLLTFHRVGFVDDLA